MPSSDKNSVSLPKPLSIRDLEEDAAAAVRSFATGKKEWFASAATSGLGSTEICRLHSAMIDEAVNVLFARVAGGERPRGRVAVAALGGYGRREMGLFCDIDLLFAHDGADGDFLQRITDAILYPFWDSGMEIGGATRTVAECEEIMGREIRAFTALTEARPICGDASLFGEVAAAVSARLQNPRHKKNFIEAKHEEMQERIRRFGDSIYLLQPNVKEGEGGLRDLHTLRWIALAAFGGDPADALARAVASEEALKRIDESQRFLWSVRHALHIIEGKRSDRLTDALQPAVAEMLGFEGGPGGSATEKLMSTYYRNAIELNVQCERAIVRVRRAVNPANRAAKLFRRRSLGGGLMRTEHNTVAFRKKVLPTDPVGQLAIFAAAGKRNLPVDAEVKEELIGCPAFVDDAARSSSEAGKLWREIFSRISGLDLTLAEMMECGLLVKWFPEMEPMLHRVQHDGYHFFTAGVHSIKAIRELSCLSGRRIRREFPSAAAAMKRVARPAVLAAATLFHDVGKGRGGDHASAGAELALGIARRLGFSSRDADDIAFLVRSHLLMSMLAFRRDVRDPGLVERFAQSMRTPELLSCLYLLTIVDLKAVGPRIWSDWKGGLLAELYGRTISHFAAERAGRGDAATQSAARAGEESKLIATVKRSLGRDVTGDEVRAFLSTLPLRYSLSTAPETVAAHLVMARDIAAHPVATATRPVPGRGCTELSVVTRDRAGLFARIAGVLSANGANIIDAQLFTSSEGIAIDLFWMTDASGSPLADHEQWERIRAEMAEAVIGGREIEAILGHRFKRRLLSWGHRHRAPEILIDNDVSAIETVVEISADDRRGLLYTIASAFNELSCSIERARITTNIDRVIDVFYIRDADGSKIVDKGRLECIRRELFSALEE